MVIKRQSGIYKIVNEENGKVYVGKSVDVKERKYKHFDKLRRDEHPNPHLQNSFNKYGENWSHVSIS